MIVHRYGEIFFCMFLADYILVEIFFYIFGSGDLFDREGMSAEMFAVLPDDVIAQFDTFRTDKDVIWALDEGFDLVSCTSAKAANSFGSFIVRALSHYSLPIQSEYKLLYFLHYNSLRRFMQKLFTASRTLFLKGYLLEGGGKENLRCFRA
jgi:hypothetical protein